MGVAYWCLYCGTSVVVGLTEGFSVSDGVSRTDSEDAELSSSSLFVPQTLSVPLNHLKAHQAVTHPCQLHISVILMMPSQRVPLSILSQWWFRRQAFRFIMVIWASPPSGDSKDRLSDLSWSSEHPLPVVIPKTGFQIYHGHLSIPSQWWFQRQAFSFIMVIWAFPPSGDSIGRLSDLSWSSEYSLPVVILKAGFQICHGHLSIPSQWWFQRQAFRFIMVS